MTNSLAVLSDKLATALHDTDQKVWDPEERNDLLLWAVAGLWPRLSRELPYGTTTITLVSGTYVYNAPTGVMAVSRLDWVDSNSHEMGPMSPGSWEAVGDPYAGALQIHIAPIVADSGGTVRLVGYGRYDTSNPIPDDYVPLVLALARAEAYRRVAGQRSRFEQWAHSEQTQDTSVAELMSLVNEADSEADKLRRRFKTWQRPVPARHG